MQRIGINTCTGEHSVCQNIMNSSKMIGSFNFAMFVALVELLNLEAMQPSTEYAFAFKLSLVNVSSYFSPPSLAPLLQMRDKEHAY